MINSPIKMTPAVLQYIWGEEKWSISTHLDGLSVIAEGEHAGKTLWAVAGELPVLIKLINAREKLSIQVHPDDLYARSVERQSGKNEMWYIVDAQPGAEVILGLKEPISKEKLRELIEKNELMEAVRRVPVKPGDCYTVPTGLIHAIGEGITLIEVQQPSNVTYRLYDYGRTDSEGNTRPLHIDKALDVVDTSAVSKKADSDVLTDWEYFRCEKISITKDKPAVINLSEQDGRSGVMTDYRCIVVAEGEPVLEYDGSEMPLTIGESVLLPAGRKYKLSANNDEAAILVVR